MKLRLFFISTAVVCSQNIFSQNVGINAGGTTPNSSAILDLNTGNTFTSPNGKGLIVPNIALTSTTDAVTVNTPFTSLLVYNTSTAGAGATAVSPGYYYWDGAKWVAFGGNASPNWSLVGNAGTTAGTNFCGTTDAVDMVFKTNNIEKARITSGGFMGIGTPAPVALLHLTHSSNDLTYLLSQGIRITNSSTTDGTYSNIKFATFDLGGTHVYGAQIGAIITSHAIGGVNGDMYFHTTINTGSVERMRILSGGNVGIGTSTPEVTLHVATETTVANPRCMVNQYCGTNTNSAFFVLRKARGTILAPTVIVNGDQIGTVLSEAYDGSAFIRTGASIKFTSNGVVAVGSIPTDLVFTTGSNGTGTEYMRITSGGNIGINNSAPGNRLSLITSTALDGVFQTDGTRWLKYMSGTVGNGSYNGMTQANDNVIIYSGGPINTGALVIAPWAGATSGIRMDNNGNVGIGVSVPTQALHVVGNICYTGGIGACSDARYKKDFTPLTNSLSNVLKMNGLNYYWRIKEFPEQKFTAEKQIGFVAQDLEKIYPELVTTDKNGYKSIDYSRLTPVLVEAIKEQQTSIKEQKEIIVSQEQEINNMKERLAFLEKMVGKLTATGSAK